MIWVLLWLLLLPPSLPRVTIDIDIDLWADAPRCGRPEWSSITCTLCFSGRWFTRDLKRRETGRRDCLGLLKDKNRLQTCAYIIIYIYCIYIYTVYIYTVYISLSVSLWVFRLLLCTGMRYTHRMYGYIQYIHVQSCILYIYVYIYVCIAHMLALNHRKCLPHVLQPMALVNSRGTNRTCQQSSCLVPETMCQFSDSHHFAWQKIGMKHDEPSLLLG